MHEVSLCEGIVRVVEDQAVAQSFERAYVIRIEIGALSAVDADALRFAFPSVTMGTRAEGAVLEIVAVPGEAWCLDCKDTVPLAARGEPCPQCGGYKLTVTGGDVMRIKDMEVA